MPQLINVLLGHMSLVGPRPPVAKEVAQYKAWQRQRLSVMPGLTCLWQVSGRSEIGFENWVRMDIWYVKHQSLWTDLKLLLTSGNQAGLATGDRLQQELPQVLSVTRLPWDRPRARPSRRSRCA